MGLSDLLYWSYYSYDFQILGDGVWCLWYPYDLLDASLAIRMLILAYWVGLLGPLGVVTQRLAGTMEVRTVGMQTSDGVENQKVEA